jgi:hypothetical protein
MRWKRPVARPPDACLRCGTPAEPGQEYCLECGSRIVPGRRFGAVGRAWERRIGRYPGDWIWASLLLLLIAAGSATAGIVSRRDAGPGRGGTQTVVAVSPVVPAPSSPPATPAPQPKPPKTSTTAPAPAPKPPNALIEWPGGNAYTVVLSSVPARGTGQADATTTAKAALARGLRDVGILVSSRFASLHPGYYVVFVGVYPSLEEAQTAANRLHGSYPNAYARQIAR